MIVNLQITSVGQKLVGVPVHLTSIQTERTSSHDSAYSEDGSTSSAYKGHTDGSRCVTELDRGFPPPSQPEYMSYQEPSTPKTSESYVPLLLPPESSPSLPVKTMLSFPIKNTAI